MTDLNFFSSYQKKAKKAKQGFKIEKKGNETILFAVLGGVTLIMILVCLGQRVVLFKYGHDIGKLEEKLGGTTEAEVQEVNLMQTKYDELNKEYEDLKGVKLQIEKLEVINDESLKSISAVMPDGIYFDGITFNAEEKVIKGIAKNNAYIAEFQNNLRRLPYFNKLFVPEISDFNGYYKFTIEIDAEEVK